MNAPLSIQRQVSLRPFNTFGLEAKANAYLRVTEVAQLRMVRDAPEWANVPRLILGGGSNIVFTRDFAGLVLHMATKGIQVTGEDADHTYVRGAAGEDWNDLVNWTLDRKLGGLENLSLIPGSVGASPVQNIGAYGAEVSDCFHSLTLFDFASGETKTMGKTECAFGYRDSIFKHALKDKGVIVDVTFALPKRWQANTTYADVSQELGARGIAAPTPRDVSDAVMAIRKRKLPDPTVLGNAGSFFKNPVVSAAVKDALVKQYPQLVSYPEKNGSFKLAAGWLVDQSGWKGKSLENVAGKAGVSETQALVLVNRGAASGQDVIALAQAIQKDVAVRFGVKLDVEPTIIGEDMKSPRDRLRSGQEAAAAGDYATALNEYVWFHNHALEYEPALYGVRLSFALEYWKELGERYLPALLALRKIRDEKLAKLLSGSQDTELFHDVASINECLEEEKETYQLFQKLDYENQTFAARCFAMAVDSVVQAEDYILAAKYAPAPEAALLSFSEDLNRDVATHKTLPPTKAPRLKAYTYIYCDRVQNTLQILAGIGNQAEVEIAREWAVALVEDKRVRGLVRKKLYSDI